MGADKPTKLGIIKFVLDREEAIVKGIVRKAPEHLRRYLEERLDIRHRLKGDLEQIVMLQEAYIAQQEHQPRPGEITVGRVGESLRAHVICENEDCPNNGKIINTVIFPVEEEDSFYEQFGHGAEDPEDTCPECKELGVLQDPLDEGSFDTACPYCHADDSLRVVHMTVSTDIPLSADGFATTDADYFNTSDEIVHCRACDKEFPLSEVMV